MSALLDNLFYQYLELIKKLLEAKYPSTFETLSADIEGAYLTLVVSTKTKQVMPSNPNQKMHVVTPLVVIALKHSLYENKVEGASKELVSKIMNEVFVEFVGYLADMQRRGLENVEDKWKKFKTSTIYGTENTYSSFLPEFVENTDSRLTFDLKKCVFMEVLQSHNESELGSIMCDYDYIFSNAISEWITFERPQTIEAGDAKCTFSYQFKLAN